MTNEATRSAQSKTIKYRPDIDGLRAVAVTSVVAYHCGLGWTKGGFVGVDVFFVISGYLIGSLVYKEIRGRTFSIANFYERRAKRILPALFGVLLFSYAAALLLLSPFELKEFAANAVATVASSSNILFWFRSNYFAADSNLHPLLMTWSLGVEEQFYVCFPLLMLLLRRKPPRVQFAIIGGLAALSLLASILGTNAYPTATFYLLPTRAWELAAGVLLAMWEANRPDAAASISPAARHAISLAGFALIALAIVSLNISTPFPGFAALEPVGGAVMVIIARQGVVNRVLSWRPIAFVGLISYSWYLWHWPLLSFARVSSDSGISTHVAVAISALSFCCAVLSWKFVEQPFRRSTTPTAQLLMRYAATAAIAMLPAVVIIAGRGLPQRNPEVAQMEEVQEPLRHDACIADYSEAHPVFAPPCVPPGSGRAIALMGDSHAAAVAPGLHTVAAQYGYRMVEFDKMSCPVLQGVSRSAAKHPRNAQECAEFNRHRIAYVLHDPSIRVVVLAAYWSEALRQARFSDRYLADGENPEDLSAAQSAELLEQGLNGLIDELERAGKDVCLMQDNPLFTFDPMYHMRTELIPPRRALARIVAASTLNWSDGIAPPSNAPEIAEARLLLAQVAAAHPKVHLIDLQDTLCSTSGCRFALASQTLFIDFQHMSSVGAHFALANLRLP